MKEELEKENQRINEEKRILKEKKKKFEEEKIQLENEKKKLEEEKQKQERERKEEQLRKAKETLEKDKEIEIVKLNKIKRQRSCNYNKNASNTQSELISNLERNINYKDLSETSSNNYKKRTIRDSELDHEELIINDSNNDTMNINNKNNNYLLSHDENQINDYKKIYDKKDIIYIIVCI